MAHVIFVVFGTRATGHEEITFEYLSAITALVYNKPFDFSKLIYRNLESVVPGTAKGNVSIYPRFITIILEDLLPALPPGNRVDLKKLTSQLFGTCRQQHRILGIMQNVVEAPMFGVIVNANYVPPPKNGFEDILAEGGEDGLV